MSLPDEKSAQRRISVIVKIYPVGVTLISIALNLFVFGVSPLAVALPTIELIFALVISAALLLVNHTWLMTTTELTRVRFQMFATPEEWDAHGSKAQDASKEGLRELERRHNAHRNTTENTVYFIFLALIFVFVSPANIAAQVWIVGFSIARLGYTYSYLAGKGNVRGVFMSLSLLALYGMASYLLIGLVV